MHFLNVFRVTLLPYIDFITNILMIAEKAAGKKRVKSVYTSVTKEEKTKGGNTKRTASSNKGQKKKEKKIYSSKGTTTNKKP